MERSKIQGLDSPDCIQAATLAHFIELVLSKIEGFHLGYTITTVKPLPKPIPHRVDE